VPEAIMDDAKIQETISDLEMVNHRLRQFMDMIPLEENEKKFLEETRQLIKKILSDLMGEEIMMEIQEHVDKDKAK
jgi:hypothetical protein